MKPIDFQIDPHSRLTWIVFGLAQLGWFRFGGFNFIFFSGSVFAYSLGSVCACGDGFLLDYFPVFNLIMRLMAASAWGMDAVNHVA